MCIFVKSNKCVLMVYAKYLDGIVLCYRFDSYLWWDCCFFVDDGINFEVSDEMGI